MTIPVGVIVGAPDLVEVTVDRTDAAPIVVEVALPTPVEVVVGDKAGPRGPQGAPGPRGPAGSDPTVYTYTNAATWTVAHNLGRIPQVQLVDDLSAQFDADVEFPDLNTAVVTHASPKSGSVLVS